MIKLSIVPLLLLLIFTCGILTIVEPSFRFQSVAQRPFNKPKDDLDEFVGKVKSINVDMEEHEFTTHFMDFENRYKRVRYHTTQFDQDGKKIEEVHYRSDGVPLPKTTYSYDENGVLLKENHYSALSGEPYLETTYVYDSSGRIKEESSRDIEEKKILSRTLYAHDEKSNFTEVADYDSGDVLRERYRFVWNNQGKVSEIVGFAPDGATLGKQIVKYDEGGNVVETILTTAGELAVKKKKYSYEFDDHGNWTRKTLYHWVREKGKSFYKLMNITYRTITYY